VERPKDVKQGKELLANSYVVIRENQRKQSKSIGENSKKKIDTSDKIQQNIVETGHAPSGRSTSC